MFNVSNDTRVYTIQKILKDHVYSKAVVKCMKLNIDQRRELMERMVHYQRIHMAGVIRNRVQELETELDGNNTMLREYIQSVTESNREQINSDSVRILIDNINQKRIPYLAIKHITSRIFFDISRENWNLVGVMPDMITPYRSAETVDSDYLEGRTTHETLYEVMIRLIKIKSHHIISRSIDNLVEISCSNPVLSDDDTSTKNPIDVFIRLLQSIVHNDQYSMFSSSPEIVNDCPRRCIQGWKSLPQSETIFQMNIAGWILLGIHIPAIQYEFIESVNEACRVGVLNILGFNLNAKVQQVEAPIDESDVDPIDLEPFQVGDDIFVLGCSHRLKSDSLQQIIRAQLNTGARIWRYANIKCPICRSIVGMYMD